MNRRKLFGFLAAAPAAVAAKSGFVTVAHHGDIVPDKPKKWYSMLDYSVSKWAWRQEYLREKYGLPCLVGEIYVDNYDDKGRSYFYHFSNVSKWGTRVNLPGITTSLEFDQAFADACINGEVPGVWCE